MFLGQYAHTVDAKGRVFVPAKYRDGLGETFVISRGTAKCITVYPMSEWEKFTAKIEELPQAQAVKIRRFIFGNASDVTVGEHVGLTAMLKMRDGVAAPEEPEPAPNPTPAPAPAPDNGGNDATPDPASSLLSDPVEIARGHLDVRLTQATVRHLPEGPGPELDRLAAHLSELRKDAARR